MAKRKTVQIQFVIETINHELATNQGPIDERKQLVNVVERILFGTDSYQGFRYLSANEVPEGHLPGINADKISSNLFEERFENTDPTRVHYFF